MATAIRQPLLPAASIRPTPSTCAPRSKRLLRRAPMPHPNPKIRALGCVVPHAGYMYSGHVAGAVYRRLEVAAALRHSVPQPHRHG